jgi:hypothetical protein
MQVKDFFPDNTTTYAATSGAMLCRQMMGMAEEVKVMR